MGFHSVTSLKNVGERRAVLRFQENILCAGRTAEIRGALNLTKFFSLLKHRNFVKSTTYLVFSLVKTLLSRNFKELLVTANVRNFHTVAQCGNYSNSLSHFYCKNFVKAMVLVKDLLRVDLTKKISERENFSFFHIVRKILTIPRCASHSWTKIS